MRAVLTLALAFAIGCNEGALPGAAVDGAAPADLSSVASVDLASVDLAGIDLADPCALAASNSTVVVGTSALPYALLGNVDVGNESSCGPPPEGVVIALSDDPAGATSSTSIQLLLPVKLGKQSAMITTQIGGLHQGSGTVDVTAFTLMGSGPGLQTLEGTVDAPGLSMSGHFAAGHCARLDLVCI
jgi:hypothetical protein